MGLIVSVLMCTNRLDDYFYRAVNSVLAQHFEDFELILVGNDLSPDDAGKLKELEKRSPKIRVILTDIRYLNFSLNLGLHHCRGDLVVRMDADDIAYPERLKEQVDFMQANPEVAVCGSAFDLIDENDRPIKRCLQPTTNKQIRNALYWSCPLCHPTVIFRKAIVAKVGGYMGNIFAQDYDLWCRLALIPGIRFANMESALLGYRTSATGEARRSKQAYAASSASQWRNFVLTGEPRWGAAAMVSAAKRIFRSQQ